MKKAFLTIALMCMLPVSSALAQQQATRGQDIDPGSVSAGAQQALELIDANRAAEIWDGSSAVAKRSITRDAFVQQATTARASMGRLVSRSWLSVIRQQVDAAAAQQAGSPPAGMYISVRFVSTFSSGRGLVELVSFRLDEDGVWRVVGYSVQ